MTAPDNPGEFERIARYFAPLARGYPLAFDLTDDAALIRPAAGCDIVVTTDGMVAGVHFFPDDPPDRIARKLLRSNLSDLAAMGAEAIGYTLVTAWRPDTTEAWIVAFAGGLADDQARYGASLIGGDTVATDGPLSFTATAFGQVPMGHALRRSGARPGDAVFVSGTIGDAGLGLICRRGGMQGLARQHREHLVERQQLPEPRLALGMALRGVASAALDVSDGLVADLGHICATSGVGAIIRAADVPVSAAATAAMAGQPAMLTTLLTAGDDYELCFTVPPAAHGRLQAAAASSGVGIRQIGEIVVGAGVRVIGADGTPLEIGRPGYRHF
jgi:thiamine-monophosphate kinase